MQDREKQKPIRIFRCGGARAAVWLGTVKKNGKDVDVRRIRIQKSYKDKNTGEWVNTEWLFLEDLPKIAAVAAEAYRYFRVYSEEPDNTHRTDSDGVEREPENDFTVEEQEK
jgi:hypothetical protein